jgi:hypothetical protein
MRIELGHRGTHKAEISLTEISTDRPMDRYHITLFIHILALLVAASATAITKLAAGRRARARTVGDVLDWHNVLMSTSRSASRLSSSPVRTC